jgi:hypothetical protein
MTFSRLFREPTLACAADDYGNCHIVFSLCHNDETTEQSDHAGGESRKT